MAWSSTSNISLPKPNISFITNNWVFNVVLPKPSINTNWLLNISLPTISIDIEIANNFVSNNTLPVVTISSSYAANNLYVLDSILKSPDISFSIIVPNGYIFSEDILKPVVVSALASDISGSVNKSLPSIGLSFIAALSANISKQVWTFNTVTTAHSRYTNYDFNSLFRLGSTNYGVHSNGSIYELTGDKDFVGEVSEANIDGAITLPATDYDESNLKSCSDAIIYGRGDGDMEIQVVLDEQQARTGYTINFDDRVGKHRKRVKIPKGLKGNLWQFVIKNVDGSWFDIDKFDVFVRTMQRIK